MPSEEVVNLPGACAERSGEKNFVLGLNMRKPNFTKTGESRCLAKRYSTYLEPAQKETEKKNLVLGFNQTSPKPMRADA